MISSENFPEKIFANLKGCSVLVIGIGGGGDLIGTIPTYCELLRLGAKPVLAGLSWKRREQDHVARPRHISEFAEIEAFDQAIGVVNPTTHIKGTNVYHIESEVAGILSVPVLTIDITGGVGRVRSSLLSYMKQHDIYTVVGVDVGGDVLCTGSEETLRSPLCDQIMLKAIASIDNSVLGVAGLGADGELRIERFMEIFPLLTAAGAYMGALAVKPSEYKLLEDMLKSGKSECSRFLLEEAMEQDPERLLEIQRALNVGAPQIEQYLEAGNQKYLRAGKRQCDLTCLTAMTLFFNPAKVLSMSVFMALIGDDLTLEDVDRALRADGIVTEFDQQED